MVSSRLVAQVQWRYSTCHVTEVSFVHHEWRSTPERDREEEEEEKGAEQWHKLSPGRLIPANENLLCLPLHPDTRAAEFQIAAVNFAQMSHAWLSPIWVFSLPFSLLLFVFCLFYSFSLSLQAALPISLWICVLVFSLSHFQSTFNCVVLIKNVIARMSITLIALI